MCHMQRKIRQGEKKKKKLVEVDIEIATLNKQKTVVTVG